MRLFFARGVIVAFAMNSFLSALAANEEPEAAGEDSSAGLPEQYAKDYLIARSTISPDKKLVVIYPTLEAEESAENANHPERIKDYGDATTDPKGISDHRWSAQLKAVWDVSQGKFTSQKITRRPSKQSD
jgi:hypothetical protein